MHQLEQAQAALTEQATHDALTGLLNRHLLIDRISQALAVAHRSQTWTGVIFIDLDGFKQINDTRGHMAGDSVLRQDSVVAATAGAEVIQDEVATQRDKTFGEQAAAFDVLHHGGFGDFEYEITGIGVVRDLLHSQRDRSVVSAIVALVTGFGQQTIAEGVEDADTAIMLRDLGVTFAQGYLFGRPAPI